MLLELMLNHMMSKIENLGGGPQSQTPPGRKNYNFIVKKKQKVFLVLDHNAAESSPGLYF